MDSLQLASGDSNKTTLSPRIEADGEFTSDKPEKEQSIDDRTKQNVDDLKLITSDSIDNNETRLNERISQCRSIIDSLKQELSEEKSKQELNSNNHSDTCDAPTNSSNDYCNVVKKYLADDNNKTYNHCLYDSMTCDERLVEYEKQLEKYQNTLNMAQLEKKNAIRKQMLAKAFKLKLMEVENQCNIELLRVKQSLQCLEPLKLIASKWQTNGEDVTYDCNSFSLISGYPELIAAPCSDLETTKNTNLVDKNISMDLNDNIESPHLE